MLLFAQCSEQETFTVENTYWRLQTVRRHETAAAVLAPSQILPLKACIVAAIRDFFIDKGELWLAFRNFPWEHDRLKFWWLRVDNGRGNFAWCNTALASSIAGGCGGHCPRMVRNVPRP
jgi:hypothetical protein